MVKYIGIVFFLFFFLTTPIVSAYAQAPRHYYDWSSTLETKLLKVLGEKDSSQEISAFNKYLFGKDLLPNNPFYFTKKWQENIQVFVTSDKKNRVELQMAIADTRLAEIQALSASQNQNLISSVASSYEKTIESALSDIQKLQQSDSGIESFLTDLEKEQVNHHITFQKLALTLPNTSKDSLQKALEATNKSSDAFSQLLKEPVIPVDLLERIAALQAQGLLTEEQVKKITTAKTRALARAELSKYVAEGIFPEADFLRLNDNIKTLFPQEFYKLYETKKILEIQTLESEKPDQATMVRLQTFAKTYKPGDPIPDDLKKYWIPVIRLEEIQNTIRPDLIDPQLLKNDTKAYLKLQEVAERVKPKPEDIEKVNAYIKKNNIDPKLLPPDYLRLYSLAQKYGAQCKLNEQWVKTSELEGKCVLTSESKKQKNEITIPSCPANMHAITVSYLPEGGYCVPNYTPIVTTPKSETPQEVYSCPVGYVRETSSGPCAQIFQRENTEPLTPVTQTPGAYPNPVYPPTTSTISPSSSTTTTQTVTSLPTPTPTPVIRSTPTPTPTSPPALKPDVSVGGISFHKQYFVVGDPVIWTIGVSNGNINSSTPPSGTKLTLKFWYDDQEYYSQKIEIGSSPNWYTSVRVDVGKTVTSGKHKIRACIDTDNELAESREENNCIGGELEANANQASPPPDCPATTKEQACAQISCPVANCSVQTGGGGGYLTCYSNPSCTCVSKDTVCGAIQCPLDRCSTTATTYQENTCHSNPVCN